MAALKLARVVESCSVSGITNPPEIFKTSTSSEESSFRTPDILETKNIMAFGKLYCYNVR